MADSSNIEWTDATWNPVAGCTILSPGCSNCYAMRLAARLEAMGQDKYQGTTRRTGGRAVWTGQIKLDDASLAIPARWRSPRRIFVNSMSDLFHDDVPSAFIERVWTVMANSNQHVFQVLTKRPERMRSFLQNRHGPVLPNVWIGTSVESAAQLDRLTALKKTAASIRFVSFEPLLGPMPGLVLNDIAWAIVGGESGPGARPMAAQWATDIREACRRDGASFFFKQWGGVNKKAAGRRLDGRTWDEYPANGAAPCPRVSRRTIDPLQRRN